jgi:hypothetical protein
MSIGGAGVAIANAGGEEFERATPRLFAAVKNQRREGAGSDEAPCARNGRRKARIVVGQLSDGIGSAYPVKEVIGHTGA